MGILNKLFGKLFGSKPQQQPAAQSASPFDESNVSKYMAKWEKERLERVARAELTLKDTLISYIKDKKELTFTWESGNDEAFITFGDTTPENEHYMMELEEYIMDKLDIPSAGEFSMTGSGSIYLAGNTVKLKHSSVIKELVDYNEETEEEIYGGEEVTSSGDEVIFTF